MPQGPDIPKLTTDITWTPPPQPGGRRALTRFDVLGAAAGLAGLLVFVVPSMLVLRHPWPELVRYLAGFPLGWGSALVALTINWLVASRGHARPMQWIKAKDRRSRAIFDSVVIGAAALLALLAAPDEGAVLYAYAAVWLAVLVLRLRFDGYLGVGHDATGR